MAVNKYKPTTPGRRHMAVPSFDEVTKSVPEKSLVTIKKKHSGRNSYGRITVRHRGGGNRKKYRIVDFKREATDQSATVVGVEYDPNRTSYIALVQYENGDKKYIIAPAGLTDGTVITSGAASDIKPGNCLPVANIPVGTFIHNIELYPGKGGQLVRAAGAMAQLLAKENGMGQIRLPSGEMRVIRLDCKGDDRAGRKHRARHDQGRQGRQNAPSRHSPDGSRLGHEPLRSPARRRRGQIADRQAGACHPVGQTHAGL